MCTSLSWRSELAEPPTAMTCHFVPSTLHSPHHDIYYHYYRHQSHNVTVGYFVPPIMLFLAKHPMVKAYDISSLRFMRSSAAPLDAATQRQLSDALNVPILQAIIVIVFILMIVINSWRRSSSQACGLRSVHLIAIFHAPHHPKHGSHSCRLVTACM